MNNTCPYCGCNLPKALKRKGECQFCKKTIYVRNRNMVTEYEANKIDWLVRMEFHGITNEIFENQRMELLNRWHKAPLFNDICWSILNKLILKYKLDYSSSSSIYLEMAHILELEGKSNKHMILQANKTNLMGIKKSGYKYVRTFNCNDQFVCNECRKMADEKIPIDIALKENPIPNRCKNKDCRCWYGPEGSLLDNDT